MFRFRTLGLLLVLAGCSDVTAPQPASQSASAATNVKLALNWYPEVEHGGFIAADTLGLFAKRDLDVEIVPGGPGAPQLIITELAAGRIQFAVSDADNVVKARAAGVPIVALMATMQNSPRCIMVHKAAGFQTLEDLTNVELAISESRPFARWMKAKLPLTGVTMVPFNGLVGEFLLKPNFGQQAFVFSEPFVAQEKGGDPQVLMVSDTGFNPYASVLVTTEELIASSPDLVRSVVQASIAGWDAYFNDPAETNAAIHVLNVDMSMAALQFGVTTMEPLCKVSQGEASYGMTLERWTTLVSQIEEVDDVTPGSVRPNQCFTNAFLP